METGRKKQETPHPARFSSIGSGESFSFQKAEGGTERADEPPAVTEARGSGEEVRRRLLPGSFSQGEGLLDDKPV
jgi:hypothetical protein